MGRGSWLFLLATRLRPGNGHLLPLWRVCPVASPQYSPTVCGFVWKQSWALKLWRASPRNLNCRQKKIHPAMTRIARWKDECDGRCIQHPRAREWIDKECARRLGSDNVDGDVSPISLLSEFVMHVASLWTEDDDRLGGDCRLTPVQGSVEIAVQSVDPVSFL